MEYCSVSMTINIRVHPYITSAGIGWVRKGPEMCADVIYVWIESEQYDEHK